VTDVAFLKRIDALLALEVSDRAMNSPDTGSRVMEIYQGALHLLRMTHGSGTPQEKSLIEAYSALKDRKFGGALFQVVQPVAVGTLRALRSEIEDGLIGSVAQRGAGEALADFATLAKEALEGGRDTGRHIAAVLTAALYEDTIRRLGAAKAGVTGRPDLSKVVDALKSSGVLKGAATAVALSYLKFRNDSLHADWGGITVGTIESCLSFVEGLLLDHFA
jgi:hypothetical protein